MKSTNTFGVQFIARTTRSSSQDLMIYVLITVNKKPVEISLKQTISPLYWDKKARQVKGHKALMRTINPYMEEVRFKLMECYRQLQLSKDLLS